MNRKSGAESEFEKIRCTSGKGFSSGETWFHFGGGHDGAGDYRCFGDVCRARGDKLAAENAIERSCR